jgi:hypothetical protein
VKTVTVRSFAELGRLLEQDARKRIRAVRAAVRSTARAAVPLLKQNVPVAFGELRESIHAESTVAGARTIADAPHAAAIELGARPHWIPLEPLLKWVKLRAAQGLLTPRQVGMAGAMRAMEKHGAVPVDAAERIARAIQAKLAKTGSPPHWYARNALPEIEAMLDARVRIALRDVAEEA